MKKSHVMDILTNKEAAQALGIYESGITRMADIVPVKHRQKLLEACRAKVGWEGRYYELTKKRLKQLEDSL